MNTIKVYSSKLGTATTIKTNANNWKDLESELVSKNLYNKNSMKAIDKDSQTSLELPTGRVYDGMTVFLLPTKNDSGALSNAQVQKFVEQVLDFIDALKEDVEYAATDMNIKTENQELKEEAEKLIEFFRNK